jgi:hypothetical protein
LAKSRTRALPDWDANSPTLRSNLTLIDAAVHGDAVRRVTPTLRRMRENPERRLSRKSSDPR